jgi:hypothetical protein
MVIVELKFWRASKYDWIGLDVVCWWLMVGRMAAAMIVAMAGRDECSG